MATIYRSAEGQRKVEQEYRSLLAEWPVPSEQLTVETGQGPTFVLASGPPQGQPLLLLHGSTSNSAAWIGDITLWSSQFRTYAIDMIGEPGLSAPARPAMDSSAYAQWLEDVTDGLGVTRANVVGLSLGGWLALDYATRRPERVERMAVLCPCGIGRQRWGTIAAASMLLPFGAAARSRAMRMILGTDLPTDPLSRRMTEFLQLVRKHFSARIRVPLFSDETLASLNTPTLVVVGGRDGLLDSAQTAARLRRFAPTVAVRMLPEAGHLILGQTEPIMGFLTANGTRR